MPPILRSRNRNLYVDLRPLFADVLAQTVMTADAAAAATTITVRSSTGIFDQTSEYNCILLIGEPGAEDSEIVLTHATTDPTATVITLASGLVRAHSAGTKVRVIKYNQIELSRSATATGTKATLDTTNDPDGAASGILTIRPGETIKAYPETEFTAGFYFARFRNSVATAFGDYSDAVPYGGYGENTVAVAIDFALRENNLVDERGFPSYTELITPDWCFERINDCLNYIQGKQLRWDEHQSLNNAFAQTSRGVFIYALPSDIYDNDSNKSIIGLRVGDNPKKLTYKDPLEFDELQKNVKYTTTSGSHASGATTLNVVNSYDFDDGSAATPATLAFYVSGTRYTITYTAVTRSTTAGSFTGVPASGSGSITVTIPASTYIYQDEKEGKPLYFTVRGGNVEIAPIPDASWDNMNMYLDYWTVATAADSEGDTLDTSHFEMVKFYLSAYVRARTQNNGKLDPNDSDFLMFKERLNDAVRTKGRGLKYKMKPRVNRIKYTKAKVRSA